MLEYEKKILLTDDEYHFIMMLIGRYAIVESQTNYYFDTDDLSMNKQGTTYRIRAKNGKYKATIKKHNVLHPDCNSEVDLIEKSEFDPEIFNVLGLHCQGELVTKRVVMYKDDACEMVLDQNIYLGYTDFELEIKYCQEGEGRAQKLIKDIAKNLVSLNPLKTPDEFVSRVGQGGSKSERFFARLKNLK